MEMKLKYARGISYSQLYNDSNETVDSLLDGLPTCESVLWLTYVGNRKVNMTISENEYNIICPLLFQFDSDLRDRIIKFMGPVGQPTDQFIDLPPLLKTVEYLLNHSNYESRELTKEDKGRLFKAYLIFCDEFLIHQDEKFILKSYTADDMLRYYIPFALRMNKVLGVVDPLIELPKSKMFLIDFPKKDTLFASYVSTYLKAKGCQSSSQYMLQLFSLVDSLLFNEQKTNVIKIAPESQCVICDFLDNFCVNLQDVNSTINIQEYPLYKISDDTYCVLYIKFFVNKFFRSLLFDMAKELEKQKILGTKGVSAYVQLKQLVGQKFIEQYLFYDVINRVLASSKYKKVTGEQLSTIGSGLPDYYARKANRVFIFEFKDIQLNAKIIESNDYDTIISAVEKELVENEKGRPKGVTQLANDIEKHLYKLVGKGSKDELISVYPILVYTDSCFDIEGFNYYLNNRFREIISERNIDDMVRVKDLVMVNIDALIMFEKVFADKKLKFDVLLNEYISYKESKNEYQVVPFGKYLFQKAKAKGYFYKASYLVRETINQLERLYGESEN